MADRVALVWNFDDDNFTWMDASAINAGALSPAVCISYGFDPGWQAKWGDLEDKTITWEDLQNGADPWGTAAGSVSTKWDDFYEAGEEQNLYYLTPSGVWRTDQYIDKTGVKDYFVERVNIDYDDIVPQWLSNTYKYANQIHFHLQSPTGTDAPNSFAFTVGGGNNLMDPPVWQSPVTLDLLGTVAGGRHKIDFRATWRYHAMKWDFGLTDEIAMTSVDINVEEISGR
jgi:hypothetical protein